MSDILKQVDERIAIHKKAMVECEQKIERLLEIRTLLLNVSPTTYVIFDKISNFAASKQYVSVEELTNALISIDKDIKSVQFTTKLEKEIES